jgi:hypothetical protein
MDYSGSLGALKQVWLNEDGETAIIPLKQLETLCPVVYNSTRNEGAFICRTTEGDVVLKNNGKGMPYLDLSEFEVEAIMSFAPKAALSFVTPGHPRATSASHVGGGRHVCQRSTISR